MDTSPADNSTNLTESQIREQSLAGNDRSSIDVPELGKQSSVKVTKTGEDLDLGGSLQDNPKSHISSNSCSAPGEPPPSVDNLEDAGIDCTRTPDWRVVESNKLLDTPKPNEIHNDKYWDERSLDTQLQSEDLQEKMIREELESFDRAASFSGDESRPFQNEVLDPYHAGGKPPSEPSSRENSLDSFI